MRVAQDATTALADAARIHRKRLQALIARRAKYRFAENFHAAVLLLRIYRSTGARSVSPQEPLLPRNSGPFVRSGQSSRMNQAIGPPKSIASTSPGPNQNRDDIVWGAAGLSVNNTSPSTR